jgi:hypothetical protein
LRWALGIAAGHLMGVAGIPHPTGMGLAGAVDAQPGVGAAAAAQTVAAGASAGVAAAAQAGVEPAAWLAKSAFAAGAASNLGRSNNAVRWGLGDRRTSLPDRVSSRAAPSGWLDCTGRREHSLGVADISDVLPVTHITVYQTGPEVSLPAASAAITLCWRGE